jgi:hypothetical protein
MANRPSSYYPFFGTPLDAADHEQGEDKLQKEGQFTSGQGYPSMDATQHEMADPIAEQEKRLGSPYGVESKYTPRSITGLLDSNLTELQIPSLPGGLHDVQGPPRQSFINYDLSQRSDEHLRIERQLSQSTSITVSLLIRIASQPSLEYAHYPVLSLGHEPLMLPEYSHGRLNTIPGYSQSSNYNVPLSHQLGDDKNISQHGDLQSPFQQVLSPRNLSSTQISPMQLSSTNTTSSHHQQEQQPQRIRPSPGMMERVLSQASSTRSMSLAEQRRYAPYFSAVQGSQFVQGASMMDKVLSAPDNSRIPDMAENEAEVESYYSSSTMYSPQQSPRSQPAQAFTNLYEIDRGIVQNTVPMEGGSNVMLNKQHQRQYSTSPSISSDVPSVTSVDKGSTVLQALSGRRSTVKSQIPPERMASLIQGPDPQDGKYVCLYPDCNKRFGRKYNIQSHIQTHLADRPYRCPTCRAGFVRRHDLRRHVRIHAGDKPYVCMCSKSFARMDALTRHRHRYTFL